MGDYYILNGHEPVSVDSVIEWAQWYGAASRRVAIDKLFDEKVEVSTVFLGLDHSFHLGGPPILFETMVFGGPLDGEMDRYSTWDEAEEGHKLMVERVMKEGEPSNETKLSDM